MSPQLLIGLAIGFALGLTVALVTRLIQGRTGRELAVELFRDAETQRKAEVEAVLRNVKASFGSLSLEALKSATDEFLKLAREHRQSEREQASADLEGKKGLIDQQLQRMSTELDRVAALMKELEVDRIQKFGELSAQLQQTSQHTATLAQATGQLRDALANARVRGQWGERMAGDVLRLAGLVENVNYRRQRTTEGGARPDFTFLLPRDLMLNMDVKFPLDNYLRFLEAATDADRAKCRADFLRDVRAKVKEVTTREYIDPEQKTLDYALLFIPNEQIYGFIHEQDGSLMDDAIACKVVLCSPMTLFAVLSVIRQAIDNFTLEQTSREILSLFGAFRKQWGEFLKKLELVGRRIQEAQQEYETLTVTRRRQLERPLNLIEEIRLQRGLPAAAEVEEEEAPPVETA